MKLWRKSAVPLESIDGEGPAIGRGIVSQGEIDNAEIAAVLGLDLDPPATGPVVLLGRVGAEAGVAAAADLEPRPPLVLPSAVRAPDTPVHEDGVAEPVGGEDAREAMDDVSLACPEILVAVAPRQPPGALMLEEVRPARRRGCRPGGFRLRLDRHLVVDAHVLHRQGDGRDDPGEI